MRLRSTASCASASLSPACATAVRTRRGRLDSALGNPGWRATAGPSPHASPPGIFLQRPSEGGGVETMGLDPKQFLAGVVRPTLAHLGLPGGETAVRLVFGTAAHESGGFQY